MEEEGLDERSIISLDAATRITKNGTSCFSSLDGKERCYVHALPGECDFVNSFGTDGRRRLEYFEPCPDFDETFTLKDGYTKAVAYPRKGYNCGYSRYSNYRAVP